MSNVPPDQQPPGGGYQPGAGWQQPQPPPPPPPGGYGQPQYGGYPQDQQPVGPGGQPLAEWWKRLLAIIIDGLILGVPLTILFVILVAGTISETEIDPITGELEEGSGLFTGAFFVFWALSIVASLLYYGLLNGGARGQTVGKMVMKIRVLDASSGGAIGVGRGIGRAAIPSLLGAFCGLITILDGLWPLWDQRRQALHDKAVSSVVVDA